MVEDLMQRVEHCPLHDRPSPFVHAGGGEFRFPKGRSKTYVYLAPRGVSSETG